jgi:hypothetical protein
MSDHRTPSQPSRQRLLVKPLFPLGQVVGTPAAIKAIGGADNIAPFLDRHLAGDWGDVPPEDKKSNDDAVIDGSRILSAYTTPGGAKFWIITEGADDKGYREATTLLLPEEY